MKARLPPPRSVAVTQVVAPAVPVVPEAVVRPVVVLVPVVARQAEAEPALVAEAVVRPVVVQVAVVLPAVPVAERVAERFPSEQWSKPVAAGWAVLRSSSPWPHLRLRSRCLRWRWLPLP
ncbi:hypothetical protein [Mycolicibacterium frederiksbergense]|uniref:hypothetical protein n=1 Tax=Mycolicibacterium frederiksbergense TaxID=117567 RepID=UPI001AE3CC9F|nr:hypothetical protein [Mycolicibacterium frederiksbergense]